MHMIVHTDGGARGNPGPAAVGVVIEEHGKTLASFGKQIGETTNNVAEYTAAVEALKWIKNYLPQIRVPLHGATIQFYLDSNLVVQQLNGRFKVKEPKLRELLAQIRILEAELGVVIQYSLIPREQNRRADFLVNAAFDNPHVVARL